MKKIRKFTVVLFLLFSLFFLRAVPAYGEYPKVTQYLYEEAEEYYQQGHYDEALAQFKLIVVLDPEYKEARRYIQRIQRMKEQKKINYLYNQVKKYYRQGKYERAIQYLKRILILNPKHKKARRHIQLIKQTKKSKSIKKRPKAKAVVKVKKEIKKRPKAKTVAKIKKRIQKRPKAKPAAKRKVKIKEDKAAEKKVVRSLEVPVIVSVFEEEVKEEMKEKPLAPKEEEISPLAPIPKERKPKAKRKKVLFQKDKEKKIEQKETRILSLDDELWAVTPKPFLEIVMGMSLTLEGKTITRYLIEKPDKLEVQRIDRNKVMISAKEIGSSFLHLWDDQGRWTFPVRVISSYIPPIKEEILVFEEDPFRVKYVADWQSHYQADSINRLERQVLSFNQWTGIEGPSPYGDMDASFRLSKFADEQEVTYYTLGLTDGNIGNFKDFSLRGFDFYTSFSRLSFPGQSLRGGLGTFNAFDRNIQYTVLQGKEGDDIFGFSVPGVLEKRKSFIEGIRIGLFPHTDKKYFINYARGYGADRQVNLKDQVYSFEGEWKLEGKRFNWEVAHDGETFASFFDSRFQFPDGNIDLKFRNFEKDFTTITGNPPERGEIGGVIAGNWKPWKRLTLSADLDMYRERFSPHPDNPKKVNVDWDNRVTLKLGEASSLQTSLSYINEPGLSFPRRFLTTRLTYSTLLEAFNRKIYPLFGVGYARSRNPLSPSSDYDTYKGIGGFRLRLSKNLSYRLNYEYNWLKERATGEQANPVSLETGLNYHLKVLPDLDIDARIFYRDENSVDLPHAFLSGEDWMEGALRFNWSPSEDFEFFTEARLRKTWGEVFSMPGRAEADVLWGLRTSWDTLFRWNPHGQIRGIVFKDLNGNGIRDEQEPPLQGIKLDIGKRQVTTDQQGRFSINVRAKRVVITLDKETLPSGYILSTPSSSEVVISKEEVWLNFGASVFSSVYGVVYYDVNTNGKFDREKDIPLPNIRLFLDEAAAFTNLEGAYYFRHLPEGEYLLKLDIHSIPMEYIPVGSLRKEIDLSEGSNYFYAFPLKRK